MRAVIERPLLENSSARSVSASVAGAHTLPPFQLPDEAYCMDSGVWM